MNETYVWKDFFFLYRCCNVLLLLLYRSKQRELTCRGRTWSSRLLPLPLQSHYTHYVGNTWSHKLIFVSTSFVALTKQWAIDNPILQSKTHWHDRCFQLQTLGKLSLLTGGVRLEPSIYISHGLLCSPRGRAWIQCLLQTCLAAGIKHPHSHATKDLEELRAGLIPWLCFCKQSSWQNNSSG